MSKRDDDEDKGGGFSTGDVLGALAIGAAAGAVAVGAMLLTPPRRRRRETEPMPPRPEAAADTGDIDDVSGAAADMPRAPHASDFN